MRRLAIGVALFASLSTIAHAGPKEEALALLDRWAKAFSDSDVDTIVNLHAQDALFMGTQTKSLGVNLEGIRAYFQNALLNNRPRGAKLTSSNVLVLSDTVVAVSGLDELSGVRDGNTYTTNGRVTLVVAKRGADWKIVQFHRSPVPK